MLLVALASGAQAQEREPRPRAPRSGYANPSAAIAAEIAFARLAQDKGQWAAFRDTAAPGAVMFAPEPTPLRQWLKNRAKPATAPRWQPHAVWSSCDGTLMVSTGAWQSAADSHGAFTTVWERQETGAYKWVITLRNQTPEPPVPEMIAAKVAECAAAKPRKPAPDKEPRRAPVIDLARPEGSSRDGTLRWSATKRPDGARVFVAEMATGAGMQVVREAPVPATP